MEHDSRHATRRQDVASGYVLKTATLNTLKKISRTRTLYVGKIGPGVSEEMIYSIFTNAGNVNKVIMGVYAHTHQPAGFAFVIMNNHKDATNAVKHLRKIRLAGNAIDVDLDEGFVEGRQYARRERIIINNNNNFRGNNRGGYRGGYRDGRGGRGGNRGGYRAKRRRV